MLAYNGQIPGPTIRAPQGATVTVEFRNDLPFPTTVHWHGIRLDAPYDGVPGLSQDPVPPGGTFRYVVELPDEGAYWYHAHVREDAQQDLGLYGFLIVEGPRAQGEARLVEHEVALDDLLLDGADVLPYAPEAANHAMMGRFGNAWVVNGAASWETTGRPGERLRLHLLDAANVRPFNVSFPGAARVELIGVDGGFLAEPRDVASVLLAPSQRATVDVVLPAEGEVRLVHAWPRHEVDLARVLVAGEPAEDAGAPESPHARARASLADALAHDPRAIEHDWELDFRILDPALAGGHDHDHGPPARIEWEDHMPAHNAASTTEDVAWVVRDRRTLDEGAEITAAFPHGTLVDVRIVNKANSGHPMQHPIHLHGQRFLVRSITGGEAEVAWRDTVLVPAGATAVITVEASNPGAWMFHCHIPEHMEAGMMGVFTVA